MIFVLTFEYIFEYLTVLMLLLQDDGYKKHNDARKTVRHEQK